MDRFSGAVPRGNATKENIQKMGFEEGQVSPWLYRTPKILCNYGAVKSGGGVGLSGRGRGRIVNERNGVSIHLFLNFIYVTKKRGYSKSTRGQSRGSVNKHRQELGQKSTLWNLFRGQIITINCFLLKKKEYKVMRVCSQLTFFVNDCKRYIMLEARTSID